jgi:hypothetical protein
MPPATFTSIQAAVNTTKSGDVIGVCADASHEQVVIDKSLSVQADNDVIVIPGDVVANPTSAASGEATAAIILMQSAENVELEGLIVHGSANGITSCSPNLIGILYQDASGSIEHNAVRNVRPASGLPGCQNGGVIVVESSANGQSNVTIADNSVDGYQKNGIRFRATTARCSITSSPAPHSVFSKYPDQPAPIISATNTSPPSSMCRILPPQGA